MDFFRNSEGPFERCDSSIDKLSMRMMTSTVMVCTQKMTNEVLLKIIVPKAASEHSVNEPLPGGPSAGDRQESGD